MVFSSICLSPAAMEIKQPYYAPTDPKYYYSQVSDNEYFKNIFPGYSFHPIDAQLIVDYLIPKIKNEMMPRSLIKIVNNIYDLYPEYLEGRIFISSFYMLICSFLDISSEKYILYKFYWVFR